MKKKLNVLFAAYEAVPFIKTGGLGDVAGSLPAALNGEEVDVRVVLPKLAQTNGLVCRSCISYAGALGAARRRVIVSC